MDSRMLARLEWAKWFAFGCMVIDHAGALFEWGAWSHSMGRVVFPVFALCFAAAYAQEKDMNRCLRASRRLAVLAIVAQLITPMEVHSITLNALFVFSVSALIWGCIIGKLWFSALVFFVLGGACVEYWWIGLAFYLSAATCWRHYNRAALVAFGASFAGLCWLNDDWITLFSVAIVAVSWRMPVIPRGRVTFQYLYPLHLGILALLHT